LLPILHLQYRWLQMKTTVEIADSLLREAMATVAEP
jgi:hypothetical protein